MHVYYALIVFVMAFAVTFATVPLSKKIACTFNAIDYPGDCRMNTMPLPRCGGISLYLGLCAGALTIVVGVYAFGWPFDSLGVAHINYPLLFAGVSAIFIVGLVDDILQIGPLAKFLGQIAAATLVAFSSVIIDVSQLLGISLSTPLSWINIPVTVLYLVVFVNIVNLSDGLDGLATGIVTLISLALFFLFMAKGSYLTALITVAITAVCLAFLRFNYPPASLFMGDSGSHVLGLMLGVVSIMGATVVTAGDVASSAAVSAVGAAAGDATASAVTGAAASTAASGAQTQNIVSLVVPLIMAGVPLFDTCFAIVRRLRAKQSIGKGDLDHLHHRLARTSLGPRKTVWLLWLCTAALCGIALTLAFLI